MQRCNALLPLLSFILFLSCQRPCEDIRSLGSSSMVIYPFNSATNNYFYPRNEATSPFKKDSLQIINENGFRFQKVSFGEKTDPRNVLESFYAIQLSPAFIIPDDNEAFDQEKSRKIYIKYDATTIDTLQLVFKARKIQCGKSEYAYLKIYHRNALIASVSQGAFIDFKLTH